MSISNSAIKTLNCRISLQKKLLSSALIVSLFAMVLAGCHTMSKSQKGAVIGGAGGAVVGGAVGSIFGKTAMGAIIGAATGGVTGAVIGHKMDKQAEEIAKEMKDAEVIRQGEAIAISLKEKVLFAYDRSDLSVAAKSNLDKLNAILLKYPETNITIIGHTDSKGTETYNQTLSESRANSVSAYASQNGVMASRLVSIGKGESDPVATNTTTEGSALNRRVEFVITANDKMKEEAKVEAGK
jgi:outer membrane protein OmpA-like peptidoglycan-associated protein